MADKEIISFDECLQEAARIAEKRKPTVVVAGAGDPVTMSSVWEAYRKKLVEVLLVGEAGRIEDSARETGADITKFKLIDRGPDHAEIISCALDLLQEQAGDLLMKGAVKTGELLGAYLDRRRGFRTGRTLSHLGVFEVPGINRLMIITDGGLNLQPDLERKKEILQNAVEVAHLLGIDCPRVAVLAHVEKSPDLELPMIRDAVELTRANREGSLTGCYVDGPLALDNAVSAEAAARKGIGGPVAGKAHILLANEIGMGNVIYKAVQLWCGGKIAGIVVGGKIPVITPSRADSPQSKLAAIAVGVLLASRKS